MVKRLFRVGWISVLMGVLLFSGGAPALQGQDDGLRRAVANLQQDLAALQKRVGELQLEVESLRSENQRLRQTVQQAGSQSDLMRVVESRLESMRNEIARSEADQRRKLGEEISAQIERLAERFQQRLQEVARGGQSRPAPVTETPRFSQDFPKNGIQHVVERGDTISGLAQRYGSRVDWIRNANQIADPSRDLRVGQTVFIPQE